MSVLSDDMLKEIGKGAAAARDLETWLASEPRDLDGDLSPEAVAEEAARRRAIRAIGDAVLGMAPERSAFDVASEIAALAAGGCQNALGHMLFARSLESGA